MAKRRLGLVIAALCLCACMLSFQALAASTADAKEPICIDEKSNLTVCYTYEETAFSDQPVTLYKIADISENLQYSLTASFASTKLILNGIQSSSEWNVVRSTLEVHILANHVVPTRTVMTDASGQAIFTQLTPGLYFVSALEVAQAETTCSFDSALVALPGLDEDGFWQHEVCVSAKPQVLPPIQPDEEIHLSVLKLWKGDEGRTDRPRQIEVEILRNAEHYETVILSQENNWSYSWSAKKDGASWNVIERNVPTGYTMTVQQREATFILTNTRSDTPDTPIEPPKTGDTSNTLAYILLMIVSGTMLVILGIIGKRTNK